MVSGLIEYGWEVQCLSLIDSYRTSRHGSGKSMACNERLAHHDMSEPRLWTTGGTAGQASFAVISVLGAPSRTMNREFSMATLHFACVCSTVTDS
jgi:hypothetical protein